VNSLRDSAKALVAERFLLEEDAARLIKDAESQNVVGGIVGGGIVGAGIVGAGLSRPLR